MSRLGQLIEKMGDEHNISHLYDFGIAEADFVADFHNNNGLEFSEDGVNYAIQYASVGYGNVNIGMWTWNEGEDFDTDATFEVYEERELSETILDRVYKRIEEIWNGRR